MVEVDVDALGVAARPHTAGRVAAWAIAFVPLAVTWRWVVDTTPYQASYLTLPLVVILMAAAVVRWPRYRFGVAGLVVATFVASVGLGFGLRYAFLVLAWGTLTGVALGTVSVPAPLRREMVFVPGLIMAAGLGAYLFRPERIVVPLGAGALAGALMAGAMVVSDLRERLAATGAVLRDRVTPIARPVWSAWQALCERVLALRDSWWGGDATPGGAWSASSDSRRPSLLFPFLTWLISFLVVSASRLVAPATQDPGARWFAGATIRNNLRHEVFIGHWMKWDAGQYLRIAERGYRYHPGEYVVNGDQAPVAWFPGYGLIVRVFHVVFESYETASFVATILSGLAVILLFWVWLGDQQIALADRRLAVVLLAVFPYSFMFYGAGWSDAFFVALILAAFVLLGREHHVGAALALAAAMLSRPNTIAFPVALVVVLVVVWWRRDRADRSLRTFVTDRRLIVVAAPLLALLGFIVWCWVKYDEPFLYWNARNITYQPIDAFKIDQWLKYDFPEIVRNRYNGDPEGAVNRAAGAVVVLLVLWALPAVRKRFGALVTLFVGLSIALVLYSATDFVASGRYMLVAFPAFAAWAGWLRPKRGLTAVLLVVFAASQLFLVNRYAHTVDLGW